MKSGKFICIINIFLLLPGCGKEMQDTEDAVKFSVTASIDDVRNENKAVLENLNISWSENDSIGIWGKAQDVAKFVLQSDRKTFSGEIIPVDKGRYYYAAYPYSVKLSLTSGTVSATIPTYQIPVSGSFDPQSFIAVGRSKNNAFSMTPSSSVIRIIVPAGLNGLRSIFIKGLNNETLTGPIKINANNNTISSYGPGESFCAISSESDIKQGEYNFSVIPGTFSNGFNVILQNAEGKHKTFAKNVGISLDPGTLYPFGIIPSEIEWEDGPLPGITPYAFKGAEGGGRTASGGRGGKVYYVTNLLDDVSNPPVGSLRWALQQNGPKIIMFKVSGIIPLAGKLTVRNDGSHKGRGSDITIAGETAPGDGICIKNWPLSFIYAKNIIVRFIRFRLGDDEETASAQDACESSYSEQIILDHCSMSWSKDECASFYRSKNITLQWCIIAESLRLAGHEKGSPHGYGGIWGGKDASFHHNILSRHDSRNPRFDAISSYSESYPVSEWRGNVDFRNNVIYGWGKEVGYGGEGGHFNMIGNYYKEGPYSSQRDRWFTAYARASETPESIPSVYPQIHVSGNIYERKNGKILSSITQDNFSGIIWSTYGKDLPAVPDPVDEFPISSIVGKHTTTHPAKEAFQLVLAGAGAWPRDKVDNRVCNDVQNGTSTYFGEQTPSADGLIDSPCQVGGYPVYSSLTAPQDSDGDGMPDEWEIEHGLNPHDPNDGNGLQVYFPYTNVEAYLFECADNLIIQKHINIK